MKNYKQGIERIEFNFLKKSSDGTKGGLETEVRKFKAHDYNSRRNSKTRIIRMQIF